MIYNVERPINFDQMVGQEMVVENIRNQSIRNSFFPVFILCGQYGSGKTTMARIISMAANCQDKDERGNPCGECDSCKAVLNHSAEGIIEVDGASNNGVENIRKLLEQASVLGLYKKKVIVIDEAHKLSNSAFNALLITLENPPKHCIFILCTTEKDALPDTIVSRAPVYNFVKIPDELIKERVLEVAKKNSIAISDDAAGLLSRYSNGAMRNALQLLEHLSLQKLSEEEISEEDVVKILGLSSMEQRFAFLQSILSLDISETINILRECEKAGRSIRTFIQDVLETNTDLLFHRAGSTVVGTKFYLEKLKELDVYGNADVVKANKMLSSIAAIPGNLISTERIVAEIISVMYEKKNQVMVSDLMKEPKAKDQAIDKEISSQSEIQKADVPKEEPVTVMETSEKDPAQDLPEEDGFQNVTDSSVVPFQISQESVSVSDEAQPSGIFGGFSLFGDDCFGNAFPFATSTQKEGSMNLFEQMSVAGSPSGKPAVNEAEQDEEEQIESKEDEQPKSEAAEAEHDPNEKSLNHTFLDSFPPNLEGRMTWDEAAKLGIVKNKEELELPVPESKEELDAIYDEIEDEYDKKAALSEESYATRADLKESHEELAKLLRNPGFKFVYEKARVEERENKIYLCFSNKNFATAAKLFVKGNAGIIVTNE